MNDKKIGIGIGDANETAQEFVKAWHRAEAGEPAEEPVERLYFQDLSTLCKIRCTLDSKSDLNWTPNPV